MAQVKNMAKISASNAEFLKGKEVVGGIMFNPIQDGNDHWVISMFEAGYVDRSEIYIQIINWVAPEIQEEL